MIMAATAITETRAIRRIKRGMGMTISNQPLQTTGTVDTNAADPTARPTTTHGASALDRCLFFGRVIDTLASGSVFRICPGF
jgi:hypothetical protein